MSSSPYSVDGAAAASLSYELDLEGGDESAADAIAGGRDDRYGDGRISPRPSDEFPDDESGDGYEVVRLERRFGQEGETTMTTTATTTATTAAAATPTRPGDGEQDLINRPPHSPYDMYNVPYDEAPLVD